MFQILRKEGWKINPNDKIVNGVLKGLWKNHWECPVCHCTDMKKMTVTRRTCGYLGVNDWNEGKRTEMGQRVLHL